MGKVFNLNFCGSETYTNSVEKLLKMKLFTYFCLAAPILAQKKRPITVKVNGKGIKVDMKSFTLTDSNTVNRKSSTTHIPVTPEMLLGGYWEHLKAYYNNYGGILAQKGGYSNDYVCLGENWLLHNFEGDADISVVAGSKLNNERKFKKFMFCSDGQNDCNPSADGWNDVPDFSYSSDKCDGSGSLYVDFDDHQSLKQGLNSAVGTIPFVFNDDIQHDSDVDDVVVGIQTTDYDVDLSGFGGDVDVTVNVNTNTNINTDEFDLLLKTCKDAIAQYLIDINLNLDLQVKIQNEIDILIKELEKLTNIYINMPTTPKEDPRDKLIIDNDNEIDRLTKILIDLDDNSELIKRTEYLNNLKIDWKNIQEYMVLIPVLEEEIKVIEKKVGPLDKELKGCQKDVKDLTKCYNENKE